MRLATLFTLFFPSFGVVLAGAAPADYTQGVITAPVNGTAIAPGQAFAFAYNIHGDYCISSYEFHVWLVTDSPAPLSLSSISGYYFGTFEAENYPAVPYPAHPAPAQLVMPDFSKPEGGFGGGKAASNARFQLVVVEEWDTCAGSLGRNITIAAVHVVYNATV
ncbi:hypothetical protein FA95DRAFT_1499037 [Auriscalpium vulgare]|uniref:Uncharacterized protein n=1 Tax=Auriscalpium vulgare TaxID=40419 RepID=A0ACB8RI33_9AGAM|nr:hypothetical protein FA95DRAFT_1499037 [Auriscalpium vulgare]